MAYIGNSPTQRTVLRVEARKSFALSLWFMDAHRRPVDLTGCTVRLVAKSLPLDPADVSDADNLVTSATATLVAPEAGMCQISLQAAELDLEPGEYPFVIVLGTPTGYSGVSVKGVLDVQPNPEFASMASLYEDVAAAAGLEIRLRGTQTIEVISGVFVPPGFTWMSDADKAKLDRVDEAALLLPTGGLPGHVLVKESDEDYDFGWRNPGAFDGTLDATSQPEGRTPTSDGVGGWEWLPGGADWEAEAGTPGAIANKPPLGTMAAEDAIDYAPVSHEHDASAVTSGELAPARVPRLIDLRGVGFGTILPPDAVDGDVFFMLGFVP